MVLHKNKWDHKAKISYLKKHGLTRPKQAPTVTPKWSSKKTGESKSIAFYADDSDDSDWDSQDEALLNHFYPEIGEQNISVDQKLKIKRQIVNGLREKQNEQNEQDAEKSTEDDNAEPIDSEDEMGGIYLGTQEPEIQLPDLETKLSEFILSDTFKQKNRKLLKNKVDDSLLQDYGLESYKDTVKQTDYNAAKKNNVDISRFSASDLDGMRIGQKEETTTNIRALSEEEKREHLERTEKLERQRLYDQIRTKFGNNEKRSKVLEINNIDKDNERLMQALNQKISQAPEIAPDLERDLLDLVGGQDLDVPAQQAPDLDDLLRQATAVSSSEKKETVSPHTAQAPSDADAFLDELLG